ncbi:MAG: hypothetical protein LBN10_11275 [Propionibacteriaceae bacterium]|jgi:hypothetical protein|nr:hypothetical protein [Propionibacteriaceae bacterium]
MVKGEVGVDMASIALEFLRRWRIADQATALIPLRAVSVMLGFTDLSLAMVVSGASGVSHHE